MAGRLPPVIVHISPCPNDTFVFERLIDQLRSTPGFHLELRDIDDLNRAARTGTADLAKVSAASAWRLLPDYIVIPCGGACVGDHGPLLVRRRGAATGCPVAIPGRGTTGHLLLLHHHRSRGEEPPPCTVVRFDRVLPELLAHRHESGILIHESRFSTLPPELEGVVDLGLSWKTFHNRPVPLGVLVAHRRLGRDRIVTLGRDVRASLRDALERDELLTPWIRTNANELSPEIQRLHIRAYVDAHSLDLGEDGVEGLLDLWDIDRTLTRQSSIPFERVRAASEILDLRADILA